MIALLEKRSLFLFISLFSFGLIGVAILLEKFFHQIPCNLCMLQRLLYAFVGAGALLAYFFPFDRVIRRFATVFMTAASLAGLGVAVRHVTLFWFPPTTLDPTKCLVSFGSFFDSIIDSLGGRGSCLQETMHIFGLNIPEWSALAFSFLLIVSFLLVLRAWSPEKNPA